MPSVKFIRLKTLDPECRCCGKGASFICDSCNEKLHNDYAFFIEVKDSSTPERKKPTGYAIATIASLVPDQGNPGAFMQAGIYFIRQADLKKWLGDDYNNFRSGPASRVNGRFLAGAPSNNHIVRKTAGDSRRAVELHHV